MKTTHRLIALITVISLLAIALSLMSFGRTSTKKIFITEYKDDVFNNNAVLKFREEAYKLAGQGYSIQHMSTRYNSKQFTHYITVVYVK